MNKDILGFGKLFNLDQWVFLQKKNIIID
jgi:hypothetical protein